MDARLQNDQLKADRSNFWKVVDRTQPSKLHLFSESELRDCQDYFLKVQSDSTVPPNELIMAAERLTLIRSEIDGRHGDAKYRRAQRLAWWAIALAMVSLTGAIAFAVAQFLTKPPTRQNWPADPGTSTVTAAMAMKMATPTPEPTRPPSPHTRGDSRTGVCNRRIDKHTNSDSDEAPPHKTPDPTPKHEKSRLTQASRRIFPLAFPTEANSNSLSPSATVDRTGNPTILLTSVVLQSLGPPF